MLHGPKLGPTDCVLPAEAAASTGAASRSHQGAAAKPAEARGRAGMRTITAAEWLFILRPLLYVLLLKKWVAPGVLNADVYCTAVQCRWCRALPPAGLPGATLMQHRRCRVLCPSQQASRTGLTPLPCIRGS